MAELHPTLLDALTGTFKIPAEELRPEATMEDLEMDSLAVAELSVIIKESLGIEERGAGEGLFAEADLASISAFLDAASAAWPSGGVADTAGTSGAPRAAEDTGTVPAAGAV